MTGVATDMNLVGIFIAGPEVQLVARRAAPDRGYTRGRLLPTKTLPPDVLLGAAADARAVADCPRHFATHAYR